MRVASQVAQLVLNLLGVAGIPCERVRGLGLARLSERQCRGNLVVAAIGHSLRNSSGGHHPLGARQLGLGVLQLNESVRPDLRGVLRLDAQLGEFGVELLLVANGVRRAERSQSHGG